MLKPPANASGALDAWRASEPLGLPRVPQAEIRPRGASNFGRGACLTSQLYLLLLMRADYAFGPANAASFIAPFVNAGVNGGLAAAGRLSVAAAVGAWVAGQEF